MWSDIPNNRILKWEEETGAVSVYRRPSDFANGHTRDRQGRLITPPLTAGALEGITQNSVHVIGRDLGFEVVVDDIARSDLYIADEAFVCGTAAEVSSVKSVDDREIPCPGAMTVAIAEVFHRAIRRQEDRYKDWCETL